MEVDLPPKRASQLQSRFIQVVTHLLLAWFKVTTFVQSRIPEFGCKSNVLRVCAKKGVELYLYSCISGWALGYLWTAFMHCYMNSFLVLEL